MPHSVSSNTYVLSISGYPCKTIENAYIVQKTLYGLRQSGHNWNSELNQWFLEYGYERSRAEPCMYYCFHGNTIVYVLVSVDDILIATNNADYKMSLMNDLNDDDVIKDQGLLTQYLGIEVKQTETQITICQGKYAKEILRKFGYDKTHAVGNPMEVNMRLAGDDTNNKQTGDT